jgi:hypothetical protein
MNATKVPTTKYLKLKNSRTEIASDCRVKVVILNRKLLNFLNPDPSPKQLNKIHKVRFYPEN